MSPTVAAVRRSIAKVWGVDDASMPDRPGQILKLFRIHELLSALFRDPGAEVEWMRSPQEGLGGRVPMGLALGSGEGRDKLIAHLEWLAGRR